jgi:hypothetical protein
VRLRTLLLLVVVLGGAGAASYLLNPTRQGSGPPFLSGRGEVGPPDDRVLLETLLAARAKALGKADARALAATSTGAQRARDRRSARRVRGLGVTGVRFALEASDVDGRQARLGARLTYRVRGIEGRFATSERLTAVKAKAGWRIRSVSATRGRPPWEVAPQRRVRSTHFVVWAPSSIDPDGGGLLDALEAGYARMREVLARGRLRKRYLVVVAGDAGQARRLTAQIRGLASLAAITDTEVRQEGPAERVVQVASQRLLVLWPAFLKVGPESQRTVVAHELTHAAVARQTSGRTPAWLVEGLALYVSEDRRVDEAAELVVGGEDRAALSLTGLTDPDGIATLGGSAQNAAYAYASAAAFYIADRFGQDRLLDLYDAFNDEAIEGEGGDPDVTDAATRRVLRVSLRKLERDLRRWIVTRAVVDPFAP